MNQLDRKHICDKLLDFINLFEADKLDTKTQDILINTYFKLIFTSDIVPKDHDDDDYDQMLKWMFLGMCIENQLIT